MIPLCVCFSVIWDWKLFALGWACLVTTNRRCPGSILMPEPLQLSPLDVEDQWFSSELPLDVSTPHPMSLRPSPVTWPRSFGLYVYNLRKCKQNQCMLKKRGLVSRGQVVANSHIETRLHCYTTQSIVGPVVPKFSSKSIIITETEQK